MRDFRDCQPAVLVDVEEIEGVLERERLVRKEGHSRIFQKPIRLDHELDHAEEHEVFDLSLLLAFLSSLLILKHLQLTVFKVLLDLSTLLGSHSLLLFSLLLALSWRQVVIGALLSTSSSGGV